MNSSFVFTDPVFDSCHASSVAQTPSGLAVVWFGGSQEGASDVEIWISRWDADGWSTPEVVASGIESGQRYPCWNPVLYQAPDGPLYLFYKVGPSPDRWWGLLSSSDNHGRSWSPARRLPDGILGPVKNKPVLLPDGRLVCPSSSEHDGWRLHIESTTDFGDSWKIVLVPGEIDAIQPSILQHPKGILQLLARSKCGFIATSWSQDGGITWSELETTELPNPNSGTDAVTLADARHVLVYNHTGMIPGRWGGFRTPLNLAVSDDGVKWTPGPVLETEPGEFSYPAVIQADDGMVHIVYTWQRRNIRCVSLDPSVLDI